MVLKLPNIFHSHLQKTCLKNLWHSRLLVTTKAMDNCAQWSSNQISRKPYHIGLSTFIRNRSFQPNNKVLHVSKIKLSVDYFMYYIQIKKLTRLIQKMNYSTYVVSHNLTYQNIYKIIQVARNQVQKWMCISTYLQYFLTNRSHKKTLFSSLRQKWSFP